MNNNYPRQNPTPQVTIEAVIYCVRARGLRALREPPNIARLKECDQAARDEINNRIQTMLDKGIISYDPAAA